MKPSLGSRLAVAWSFLVMVAVAADPVALPSPAVAPAPSAIDLPSAEREAFFRYDDAADFDLKEAGTTVRGAARVTDLSFAAAAGSSLARTDAYLVRPASGQPRAAVLWVHWLGEPATTNRTEFLAEAEALAARGVVSLLPNALWSKTNWYQDRVLDRDDEESVAQVIALRRALDLLRREAGGNLPIGIVGHDYGGMYASIAASLEKPVKTCVFVACTPSLLDWAFFAKKPASMDDYLQANRALELRHYLSDLRESSVFCQFAERDRYVPLEKAQLFFRHVGGPTEGKETPGARREMKVYPDAGHEMETAGIRDDRTAWLIRELAL